MSYCIIFDFCKVKHTSFISFSVRWRVMVWFKSLYWVRNGSLFNLTIRWYTVSLGTELNPVIKKIIILSYYLPHLKVIKFLILQKILEIFLWNHRNTSDKYWFSINFDSVFRNISKVSFVDEICINVGLHNQNRP